MLHRFITLFLLTVVLVARAEDDVIICKKLVPGQAIITSSEFDIGSPEELFDGDSTTLVRSKAINPCWIQFEYPEAIAVDSLNIYVGQYNTGGDLDSWMVETAETNEDLLNKTGSYLLLKPKNEPKVGGWDCLRLKSTHTAKMWKFTVYREEGDDYVHLFEIGMFKFTISSELSHDFPLASEIRANNVIYNSSGTVPCRAVFDGSSSTYFQFTGHQEAQITLFFVEPQTFNRTRVLFQNNCTWRVGWADTYADVREGAGSYTESELREAKAGEWDSLVTTLPPGKKYWKFIASCQSDTVKFAEIDFRTVEPPSELSGLSKKLRLWETWRWRNTPHNLLYYGTEFVPSTNAVWKSSDESVAVVDLNGAITAKKAGAATITATYKGSTCRTEVTVTAPVKQMEKEPLSEFLSTPRQNCIFEMPVLVVQYLPTTDGETRDPAYAPDLWGGTNTPLSEMKTRTLETVNRFKYAIEEGSRFRGYKNPEAPSSIGIKIVDIITLYEPFPPGLLNGGYNSGALQYTNDFENIFDRVDFRDYVESKGVKQIWVWGNGTQPYMDNFNFDLHTPEGSCRASFESYMSTPTDMQVMNGNNPEPLPVYDKTYTVISQSNFYPTFTAINFEPFTHQFEALLIAQNYKQDGNDDLFWGKFVGKRNRCGWTHTPPNTDINYGYFHYIQSDTNLVKPEWCDIEDWTPAGGQKSLISYSTWEDIQHQWPDGVSNFTEREELQWFIYWLQAIPGYENNIPYEVNGENARLTNWWRFWYDWDAYAHDSNGLWEYDNISVREECTPIEVNVYPNPASDKLKIESGSPCNVSIYNSLGRPELSATAPCELDISDLPTGLYTIRYGKKAIKFIKVK